MTQNKSPVLPTMNSANERAAIVVWPREQSEGQCDISIDFAKSGDASNSVAASSAMNCLRLTARAIERGDHLNQGKQETDD